MLKNKIKVLLCSISYAILFNAAFTNTSTTAAAESKDPEVSNTPPLGAAIPHTTTLDDDIEPEIYLAEYSTDKTEEQIRDIFKLGLKEKLKNAFDQAITYFLNANKN